MTSPLIHLTGVGKRYRIGEDPIDVLVDIQLDIGDGEYLAIVGPSGSGKTTLMNLIGCLDVPDRGEYRLDGEPVASLSESARAGLRNRAIGFIFQGFHLHARMTALENVMQPLVFRGVSRRLRLQRARDALERVGLGQRLAHLPSQLSGGQRQRVAIARALVTAPRLVLADEPTGNLDSRTSAEIMALFDLLHDDGHTLVVVTHDSAIAAHCQRLVRIVDGRIVEDRRQERLRA